MKRSLLLVLAFSTLAACGVDNKSSIEILGRAAPADTTACKFTAGGDFQLGPGVLDVSYSDAQYDAVLYVDNNLVDPTSLNAATLTSTKAWRAEAAAVTVNPSSYRGDYSSSPSLLPLSASNTTPVAGVAVAPAGGAQAQHVQLVSNALAQQLAAHLSGTSQMVVLGVKLEGHTLDGASLDSGDYYFPIQVCNGCLPLPTCSSTTTPTPTNCFGHWQDSADICQ